jgi:aerobic-type carbon monoxide dehydrogenase small subunit (CoxS/CutS family)
LRVSRRGLFKIVIGGIATTAAGITALLLGTKQGRGTLASLLPAAAPAASMHITMNLNGNEAHVSVKVNRTLMKVIREDLGLTGTKPGCSNGQCGSCTVLLDGVPVYSCQRLAVEVDGHQVTTIEGVGSKDDLSTLQQAFIDEGAFQCGYCTPGFILSATALLRSNPNPSADDVREGLSGNLCRCGSYPQITSAVLSAAKEVNAE